MTAISVRLSVYASVCVDATVASVAHEMSAVINIINMINAMGTGR